MHNHITRDIKPKGQCPSCDVYHENQARRDREAAYQEFLEKMKDAPITFSTKCRDCGLDYHSLPHDVVHVCGEGNFKVVTNEQDK